MKRHIKLRSVGRQLLDRCFDVRMPSESDGDTRLRARARVNRQRPQR